MQLPCRTARPTQAASRGRVHVEQGGRVDGCQLRWAQELIVYHALQGASCKRTAAGGGRMGRDRGRAEQGGKCKRSSNTGRSGWKA